MKIRPVVVIGFLLVALVFFGISLPAQAAPAPQGIQFATNTPLPDGRILYQVQPSDTSCVRIALLNQITVEQLMQLNANINKDCSNLIVGEYLLISIGGPLAASATPGPSPTPLPPTITPTPIAGTTTICVLMFNDINGDALHEENEPVIEGG
ncbi:MAG: LysM peptidoglycan-binding domain-containing protein, partial [Chloroflexi bacterium]|nr:LysM peptidoglycan-binding domain-containing protein [Chloroflexota bacterium]